MRQGAKGHNNEPPVPPCADSPCTPGHWTTAQVLRQVAQRWECTQCGSGAEPVWQDRYAGLREALLVHPWRLPKAVVYLFDQIATPIRRLLHPRPRFPLPLTGEPGHSTPAWSLRPSVRVLATPATNKRSEGARGWTEDSFRFVSPAELRFMGCEADVKPIRKVSPFHRTG